MRVLNELDKLLGYCFIAKRIRDMVGDFASEYLMKSTNLILKYYNTANPKLRMASHKREFV